MVDHLIDGAITEHAVSASTFPPTVSSAFAEDIDLNR